MSGETGKLTEEQLLRWERLHAGKQFECVPRFWCSMCCERMPCTGARLLVELRAEREGGVVE